MSGLHRYGWPQDRADQALVALGRKVGLRTSERPAAVGAVSLTARLEQAIRGTELELEPVDCAWADLEASLGSFGPGLLALPDDAGTRVIAVIGQRRGRSALLTPELAVVHVPTAELVEAVARPTLDAHGPALRELLARCGVPEARIEGATRTFLATQLPQLRFELGWIVRPRADHLWRSVRTTQLFRHATGFLATRVAIYALYLGAWSLIGIGGLSGHLDLGAFTGWALALLSIAGLQVAATWLAGLISVAGGALLKRHLLNGALAVDRDEARKRGAGDLFGRVIEVEALESLALSGGFTGVVALVELVAATAVIAAGPTGWLGVGTLGLWLVIATLTAIQLYRERLAWTDERLALTHDLIDRIAGHRTRLAQVPPERWHDEEDAQVAGYLQRSRAMDTHEALIRAVIPRGWLLVGAATLVPVVLGGAAPFAVATGLAGVLMALGALSSWTAALADLAGTAIALRQIAPLRGHPAPDATGTEAAAQLSGPAVLQLRDVDYHYAGGRRPALSKVSLTVAPGDRLLIQGPSGGGKSTLAAVLSGLREPQSGLRLLGGLDRASVGAATWRRRVALAPQFHDNHIAADTLAFNLLLGRNWPPTDADLSEAAEVCDALGLGPLLDEMPAGLHQQVGDGGWRLSHGEQSRVFLARALLQRADVVLLDESFGSLDPVTLRTAMQVAAERDAALVVIAHP